MAFSWQKQGCIYCPDGQGFFKTHAARPVPYRLDDEVLRLFFSSRDSEDRMLPTFIDVQASDPSKILRTCDHPLIDLGEPGCFDDSGVTLGSIVDTHDDVYLYYTGWKRRRVVSFELSIGILRWGRQTDTFSRVFEGPLLAQDRNHPLLVAGPFVRFEDGRFRMWYCSGTDWQFPEGNPEPIYTVFYADSDDGITWNALGKPVIQYAYDGEVVSAPWVTKVGGSYHMWYSIRGSVDRAAKNYKVGFAESSDGVSWVRRDEIAGISTSESGWDSEMICYPSLFQHQGTTYMFYSGNGVGRGGLGYAIAENFEGQLACAAA